jgi:hypothetical protein
MTARPFQTRISALLIITACVAFNCWLFRVGMIWGFIGLNLTKHVIIAQLCLSVGVNRQTAESAPNPLPSKAPNEIPVA